MMVSAGLPDIVKTLNTAGELRSRDRIVVRDPDAEPAADSSNAAFRRDPAGAADDGARHNTFVEFDASMQGLINQVRCAATKGLRRSLLGKYLVCRAAA